MRTINFVLSARNWQITMLGLVAILLVVPSNSFGATRSKKMPVVPKWARFERVFKSSVVYSNALQDASLTVVFTSPLGDHGHFLGAGRPEAVARYY